MFLVPSKTLDADAYDAAINFLQEHEDLWTEWVPDDIAEKVKESIQS